MGAREHVTVGDIAGVRAANRGPARAGSRVQGSARRRRTCGGQVSPEGADSAWAPGAAGVREPVRALGPWRTERQRRTGGVGPGSRTSGRQTGRGAPCGPGGWGMQSTFLISNTTTPETSGKKDIFKDCPKVWKLSYTIRINSGPNK